MIIWWNSLVVFVSNNFSAPSVFSQSQTVKTWSVLSSMHAKDLPPSEKYDFTCISTFNNLTGFGKRQSNNLPLKRMLNDHKCFKCIVIPDSNVRWLTFSTCGTCNLATCNKESVRIWMESQAKSNGDKQFWVAAFFIRLICYELVFKTLSKL